MAIVAVGLDLAKNVFALHGVDETGKPALVRPEAPDGRQSSAGDQVHGSGQPGLASGPCPRGAGPDRGAGIGWRKFGAVVRVAAGAGAGWGGGAMTDACPPRWGRPGIASFSTDYRWPMIF